MYEARRAPVNVGDELEVKIESVGSKGDGIAKVEGFVLFVAGTRQGEKVKVKVTKVLQNVGFAQVVSRIEGGEAVGEQQSEESTQEETPQYEDTEDFGDDNG